MHSLSRLDHFNETYIVPLVTHPVFRGACKLVIEAITMVAAKVFLEYLGIRFLSHSSKLSKKEIFEITILSPFVEEWIFRLCVLQGIHLLQIFLNDLESEDNGLSFRFQWMSGLFPLSQEELKLDRPVIRLCPSIVEDVLYRGYVKVICWVTESFNRMRVVSNLDTSEDKKGNENIIPIHLTFEQGMLYKAIRKLFSSIHVASNIFVEKVNATGILICLPFELELLYRAIKGCICWMRTPSPEMTEEEKKKKIQQVFRIHLAAFIFAAAHLLNPHPNKASALTQLIWTYLGGVVYGYLSEKYCSLIPGILAHGINNFLAISGTVYPNQVPYLLLALLVNRIASYLLGASKIFSIPRFLIPGQSNQKIEKEAVPEIVEEDLYI